MRKHARLVLVMMLCLSVLPLMAQETAPLPEDRPYLGVRLSFQGLPELLAKHLQLVKGRGLLIENIQNDSPADKAGLDKDDIIITYQDEPVTSYNDFVQRVGRGQVDQEVSLEIFHLGEKKTLKLKLGSYANFARQNLTDYWKYPVAKSKMYRLNPDEKLWQEVPPYHNGEAMEDPSAFHHQTYAFHNNDDPEYTVTIDGDPFNNNADIIVQDGENEYRVTPNTLEGLPEKYRQAVKNALESTRFPIPSISPLAQSPSPHLVPKPLLHRIPQDTSLRNRRSIEDLQNEVDTLRRQLWLMEERMSRLQGIPTEPLPDDDPSNN